MKSADGSAALLRHVSFLLTSIFLVIPTIAATTSRVVVQDGPLHQIIEIEGTEKSWYGLSENNDWYHRSETSSSWERLFEVDEKATEFATLQLTDGSTAQLSKESGIRLIPDPGTSERIWLISPNRGLFVSQDGGSHWRWVHDASIDRYLDLFINPVHPDHLVATVLYPNQNGRKLVESTDGGQSWTLIRLKANRLLGSILATPKDKVWIVTVVLGDSQSGNGGGDLVQWKLEPGMKLADSEPDQISIPQQIPPLLVPGTTDTITTLYPRGLRADPSDPEKVLLLVVPKLMVYLDLPHATRAATYPLITTPGQNQWTLAPQPWDEPDSTPVVPDYNGVEWTPIIIHSIALPDSAETFLASTPAGVIRSEEGGKAWRWVSDFKATGFIHHPTDPRHVFAVDQTTLVMSNDAGRNWKSPTFPDDISGTVSNRGMVPSFPFADSESWVLNANGTAWITHDGGATWSPDSTQPNVGDLVMVRDTTHVRLYKNRRLNVSTDRGRTWRRHTLPARDREVFAYSPTSDWLITPDLMLSSDLGLQWYQGRRSNLFLTQEFGSTHFSPIGIDGSLMRDRGGRLGLGLKISQASKYSGRSAQDATTAVLSVSLYDVASRTMKSCTIQYTGRLEGYSMSPDHIILFHGSRPSIVRIWDSDWTITE